MIETRQLTEDLARIIALRAPVADKIRQAEYRNQALRPGLSFAILEGGLPVIAGGIVPIWPGRAEGWSTVLPAASRRARVVGTRHAAALLETLIAAGRFSRIDVFMHPNAPSCRSFAQALGLVHERLLRKYMPDGSDIDLYSKVANG